MNRLAALGAITLVALGAAFALGASSCGGDDSVAVDASSDIAPGETGFYGCPSIAPTAGSACSTPETTHCKYGTICSPIAWACDPVAGWTQIDEAPPQCPYDPPDAGTACLECTVPGHSCVYDAGCNDSSALVVTCSAGFEWVISCATDSGANDSGLGAD